MTDVVKGFEFWQFFIRKPKFFPCPGGVVLNHP